MRGTATPSGPPVSGQTSPERWARFLEEVAPGLTWLASTLLEWAELPPGARREWLVTVQATRGGEVEGLAAMNEATGLLAAASLPGHPSPLFGEPERVRRLVGTPEAVDAMLSQVPVLMLRRGEGLRRTVYVHDGDPPRPHPTLFRAEPDALEALERLQAEAADGLAPFSPPDLAGAMHRGGVWAIARDGVPVAMFRVEGVARRRIQVADACVHPSARGRGLGTLLLQSAAHVARTEYARGCVVAVASAEAAQRTAHRAGFTDGGVLEDVRFT